MITSTQLHRMNPAAFLLPFILLLLASPAISPVGAQPSPSNNGNQYPYARFSPSMAIIIVVLIAALFFMGFFSIYIRHCSDSAIGAGSVRRALSLRSRRAAAARGLDASLIESFPTFSYAEVKDHQIGKGSLECAVCLNEFEDDETLRLLTPCDHVFHPECIDAWLESHVTCPVCRTNLSPSPPVEEQLPESSPAPAAPGEVVVQVVDDDDRSESPPPPSAAAGRSWSIRIPKVSVFGGSGKFRSHSTGHSMVYPGENLERFTLRLPVQVRKEVMDRASLNRTASVAAAAAAAALPRQGSSSRARFYRRIEREGSKSSDRWGFSMRAMSMRSPKAPAVDGGESGSGRTPVKMPSFKCLEPKADDDETGLFSHDQSASHPV